MALYHGLPRLGLPRGSTVLVPSYHQGIEIDTLLAAGHRVRYYRVTEQLSTDVADLERCLDGSVSALYITHYLGFAQPLAPIQQFCEAHHLKLIEDCALSLWSRARDTWLGSVGDLALFSVYKTLPIPHGGYLVTRGRSAPAPLRPAPATSTIVQMADLVHEGLRASGWRQLDQWATRASRGFTKAARWDRTRTICSGADWDPRLLEYGASPWIARLMRLMDPAAVVTRRRANYTRLASQLRTLVACPFPDLPAGTCPLFFPIMVSNKIQFQRDLAELGVRSGNWWDHAHPTCPAAVAEQVAGWRRHCLELPIHQELGAEEIDRVAAAVLSVLARQD
ncbi:MAG TPA: DegT/DnrJ/EryC1/StrS family aminotransferase [Gemmatimonadales bacterium]|nr:DegT/DnrJ/EryC1/StrS family aminotransferase [Gemmatimonadales bacterium]